MRLDDLLRGVEGIRVMGPADISVGGIAYDSRRVGRGDVFFALAGAQSDGAAFVTEALARGAAAVVAAAPVEAPGRTVVVAEEPRRTLAEVACRFHGDPSAALEVVGVTGTNGKTTITWMLESIFRAAGRPAGVIGTIGVKLGGETRAMGFTTPEAPELQRLLAEMRDRGMRAVAMEVSSHALAQRRSYGLQCDVAVFTNLTQDHLDFHGTMAAYLDAKLMLFDGRNGGTNKPDRAAVVNADDPSAERVAAAARHGGLRVLGYAVGAEGRSADVHVHVESVTPHPDGLELRLRVDPKAGPAGIRVTEPERLPVRLPLLGRYNAANAAAAITAAAALNVDRQAAVAGLEAMPAVPGRLERVEAGQPFHVVVDYAHTPDALERALAAVRDHVRGRVLLVFGCGGDRDRAKRPIMGGIAERGADRVWITNDNPRSENPAAIAADIERGMQRGGARIVLDRRDAIAEAMGAAAPGDAVLVAGKGHETTQTIGQDVQPFDDRAVARALLAERFGAGR